jgi:hypothetical protein
VATRLYFEDWFTILTGTGCIAVHDPRILDILFGMIRE